MPPRSHSSSSHSSSSRSSSSSSSRSYSSSSRSYSSSSSSRSYSSSGYGPRSHSSSSHSSAVRSSAAGTRSFANGKYTEKTSPYVSGGNAAGRIIQRKRVNQPAGWKQTEHGGKRPETHYCLRHNYIYYPESWTDGNTGKTYQKGYYDEEGTYYQDVVFRRNGRYDNVVCKCEYCGTTSKVSWTGETQTLSCPSCGGPLNVTACIDEYTQDPAYTNAPAPARSAQGPKRRIGCGIAVLITLVVLIIASLFEGLRSRQEVIPIETDNTGAIFGETVWLDRNEDGSYTISSDGKESYDKKITWDYGSDSYYDREAECWLWYNTDVVPNLWQYWYEGISSEYESGWMEYEPDGWYIETDFGEWIELPAGTDTERLWHMEIDPADFSG